MEARISYTVASNPVSIDYGDMNVLFSGESQTAAGHRLGPKVYDFYLLHHILSGHGEFVCEGAEYRLGPGQSFLIAPQRLVRYESDAQRPWRYRWIAFAGARSEALVSSVGLSAASPIADTGASRKPGALLGRIQSSFRARSPYAHLEAAGYLHLLFAEFGGARRRQADEPAHAGDDGGALIRQVVHYLSTQYAEPVSIERMADTLGFSRAYISRVFKRHTGVTPVAFLLQLRIDRARRLLRERTELTVEQIAASVGFRDPLYFSKQFRRLYGQPPTAYRERMRAAQQDGSGGSGGPGSAGADGADGSA